VGWYKVCSPRARRLWGDGDDGGDGSLVALKQRSPAVWLAAHRKLAKDGGSPWEYRLPMSPGGSC
jgi:hypothetical protein